MRLLLVEDDPLLCHQLSVNLQKQGYAVDETDNGRDGLFMGQHTDYDIAVIDIGLPLLDGISVVRELRQSERHFPILILTARSSWQDKVEGLEAGADDYLPKPFQPEELYARLNALLRRSTGHASSELLFGPLSLNTSAKTAHMAGQTLELTSYEYNTLEYLALKAGKTISKTELTEHLYDQDFDRDSNVIEVFIGRLRKKLDPDGTLKPITTVRGQGYRFTLGN